MKNYYKEYVQNDPEYNHKCYLKYKDGKKAYKEENKEKIKEYQKKWRSEHQSYKKDLEGTKEGRAKHLIRNYKMLDKKKGLPFDLDCNWIIENIFNSKCYYCGNSDWKELGCDRIDNTKGHLKDNCVPCCRRCNSKRSNKYTSEEFKLYLSKP